MPNAYSDALTVGFQLKLRTGDQINVWGSRVNDIAYRLDVMDLPDEAVVALRELFEEIGRLTAVAV